jgi:hypothetical protein
MSDRKLRSVIKQDETIGDIEMTVDDYLGLIEKTNKLQIQRAQEAAQQMSVDGSDDEELIDTNQKIIEPKEDYVVNPETFIERYDNVCFYLILSSV